MPKTVAPGIKYWTRDELGLVPPHQPLTSVNDKTEFLVHYSTGQELGRADTREWWRQIQAFHMGPERRWNDIGYGHGVDIFGNIFEGRGFLKVEAQSPGHNTQGTACVFLGNDDPGVQDVPQITKDAYAWLYHEYVRRVGHDLHRMGHRDSQAQGYTDCPGDELEKWLHRWVAGTWKPDAPEPKPSTGFHPSAHAPRFLGELQQPPMKQSRAADMWQRVMVRRGWKLDVDGIYGPASEKACRGFQHNQHLPVTGNVDQRTWNATWTSALA